MLSRLDLRGPDADLRVALAAATSTADEPVEAVREIIEAVRAGGDVALRKLTARFDGCTIDDLRVPAAEIRAAWDATDPELRGALERAAERIRGYHEAQAAAQGPVGFDADGVAVAELLRPVDRAGLYVPGGRAAYPSTVLMTAIPAAVAGVPEIALVVPPDSDGRVPQVTLAAAALAGVTEVYRVGGAQAIAALAYGTASIPAVDIIVGPGNVFVSIAKREVAGAGVVGIESPAGPSELVVVADRHGPPNLVASDLAAQAEHGPGGTAILVTWIDSVADAVDTALTAMVADAPRRDEMEMTLADGGRAVLVRDAAQAMDVVNFLAPEHLEIVTEDPDALLPLVRNAGAVFLGPYAPTALGDYAAGANHVLPTGRSARFASALRVDDFRKHVHVVRATPEGSAALSRAAAVIARAEGLDAHAHSLDLRANL
jgi:histidinol dehydrogenase